MSSIKLIIIGLFLAFLLVGLLAAGRHTRAKRVHVSPTDSLAIVNTPPELGLLHVRARATVVGFALYDRRMFWHVDIRQEDGNRNLVTVWRQEYSGQPFIVRDGQTARPVFDDRFALEPGDYNVLVALRENTPRIDQDGNIEPSPILLSDSAWQEVK